MRADRRCVSMLELQPSKTRYFSSVVEMRSRAKCQRFHNCAEIQCSTAPFRIGSENKNTVCIQMYNNNNNSNKNSYNDNVTVNIYTVTSNSIQ